MTVPNFHHIACCNNCPLNGFAFGKPTCQKAGAIDWFNDAFKCPEGRWDKVHVHGVTGTKVPTPSLWQKAARALKEATDALVATGKMANEFTKTVTSGFFAEDDPVVIGRKAACAKCPFRKDVGDKSYCGGGCGCPETWISELDYKLLFKELTCPKHFFP